MKESDLIIRIRQEAVVLAKKEYARKVFWTTILIGLLISAILFFILRWPIKLVDTSIQGMDARHKIMLFLLTGIMTALACGLTNLLFEPIINYFIGRKAKRSKRYLLPLLKDAANAFAGLNNNTELPIYFFLFKLEIDFWTNNVLTNSFFTDNPALRKSFWKSSFNIRFLKLQYFFNERLSCKDENFPIINFSDYFLAGADLTFNSTDTQGKTSQTLIDGLRKEFLNYSEKVKIELNEWADRNIVDIIFEVHNKFGETESENSYWRPLKDHKSCLNFEIRKTK